MHYTSAYVIYEWYLRLSTESFSILSFLLLLLLLFPLFWEAEVVLAATVSEVVGPANMLFQKVLLDYSESWIMQPQIFSFNSDTFRNVGRSENQEGSLLIDGQNLPPPSICQNLGGGGGLQTPLPTKKKQI